MTEPAKRADGTTIDGSREPYDTLTFIESPDLWPLGAVLPLVRSEPLPEAAHLEAFGECGVLIAAPGIPKCTVFIGVNVVAHAGLLRGIVGGTADLTGVLVKDYIDPEGITDDGWRVG